MSTVTKNNINWAPLSTFTLDGHDMGATKGGLEAEMITKMQPVTTDQTGDGAPLKSLITGREIKGKVTIAEEVYQHFVYLFPEVVALPGTTKIQTGGQAIGAAARQVELIASNGKKKLTVHKAVFSGSVKPKWIMAEEGGLLEVEFHGELDRDKTAGNQLWQLEDLVTT